MTSMEAWKIIAANMKKLYCTRDALGITPYSNDEIEAEIVCYNALKTARLEDNGKKKRKM